MKRRFSTLAIATILGLSAGFANADPVKVKDILDMDKFTLKKYQKWIDKYLTMEYTNKRKAKELIHGG